MASPSGSWRPDLGYFMDFDPKHRVLRVTAGEIVTEAILQAADAAVRQFVSAEGSCFGIFDYSAVTDLDVSAGFVRTVAESDPTTPPMKLRIAIAPQPVVYGMNRMYEQLLERRRADFQVVRTLEEAEVLLGFGPLEFSRRL
jgi:hypothetical protein